MFAENIPGEMNYLGKTSLEWIDPPKITDSFTFFFKKF